MYLNNIAKKALVFMVVARNDTWKIPVEHFLILSTTSDQKAKLVTQCVDLILQCGMLVANITSDASCTANFTMAKNFGCYFDINNPRAVMDKKLKRGETIAQYSNDVIVGKWKDKRNVLYLYFQFKTVVGLQSDFDSDAIVLDVCTYINTYYISY
jgi:hypothetical protein